MWISGTAERSAVRRTEEFWQQSNPAGRLACPILLYNCTAGRAQLAWDEYRAIQYGFLTDGHITDKAAAGSQILHSRGQ